ncbi:hypothetical protein B0J13DRAFT_200126 [Dactylonectria estremocensis]|uniref:Uncharacterized protein n=1 Tax=Dactylonectria estremocensis TaxID=1079267 RepID=A0A9P9DF69_9HYPO|nr:hypothetical protein B0J13DRAFT_200126 [Dactylonectria estremocensis]
MDQPGPDALSASPKLNPGGRPFDEGIQLPGAGDPDGFTSSSSAALRIDGQTKMDEQEKHVLIIDGVGVLGVRRAMCNESPRRRIGIGDTEIHSFVARKQGTDVCKAYDCSYEINEVNQAGGRARLVHGVMKVFWSSLSYGARTSPQSLH